MICPVCEKEMISVNSNHWFDCNRCRVFFTKNVLNPWSLLVGENEWFDCDDPEEIKRVSKLSSFQ